MSPLSHHIFIIIKHFMTLSMAYSNLLPEEGRHALLWVSRHTTVITYDSPCMSLPVKSRWVHRKGFLILSKTTKCCFFGLALKWVSYKWLHAVWGTSAVSNNHYSRILLILTLMACLRKKNTLVYFGLIMTHYDFTMVVNMVMWW